MTRKDVSSKNLNRTTFPVDPNYPSHGSIVKDITFKNLIMIGKSKALVASKPEDLTLSINVKIKEIERRNEPRPIFSLFMSESGSHRSDFVKANEKKRL